MARNVYSPEFKMSIVEEYYKRDCSSIEFAEKHQLCYPTLTNWIAKYRKSKGVAARSCANALMDVTQPIKNAIQDNNRKITLEIGKIILTFDVSNLKTVLEAFNHD